MVLIGAWLLALTAWAGPWSAEEQARLDALVAEAHAASAASDIATMQSLAGQLGAVVDEQLPGDIDAFWVWLNWLDLRMNVASLQGNAEEQQRLAELGLEGVEAVREQLSEPEFFEVRIVLLNQLANANLALGRVAEALRVLHAVFEACEALYGPDDPTSAVAAVNLAVAYMAAGDPATAIDHYDMAAASLMAHGGEALSPDAKAHMGGVYLNRGRARQQLHDAQGALSDIELAMPLLLERYGSDHPIVYGARRDQATALRFTGDCQQALALLDPIVATLDRAGGQEELTALLHEERAMCLLDQGDPARAADAQERVVSLTPMDGAMRANRLLNLSVFRERVGDGPGAREAALQALSLETLSLEGLLETAPDRVRLAAIESRWETLSSLLARLTHPDDQRAVYGLVLRWKSAATQSIRAQREAVLASTDPDIVELRGALASVRRESLERLLRSEASPLELHQQRDGLEMRLAAFAPASRPQPSPRQLCQALPEDGALVDYVLWGVGDDGERSVTAFVLLGGACEAVHRLDLTDPFTLSGEVQKLWNQMYASKLSSDRAEQLGSRVRAQIWDPLLPLLDGRTRVWTVPHHYLGRVPMHILSDGDGGYLLERFSLHQLDAAEDLVRPRSAPGTGALLLGSSVGVEMPIGCHPERFPALPGVAAEIKDLRRTLRQARYQPVEVLTGSQATGDNLAAAASGRALVHIGAHGSAISAACRPDVPVPLARWGLVLDDGKGGSNWLSAEEVALWDLRGTELVTLSACWSGRGEEQLAGVLGLRWALNVAGAEHVLATLWPVEDDVTRELMSQFYRFWIAGGMGPAEALRAAQLDLLRRYRESSGDGRPDLWGAYVLTGVRP